MVHSNNFVVAIKHNGKILREKEDNTVILPFGSEYSLLLKNLESVRAKIQVSIDGKDVLGGSSIVIEPNSETELFGFLEGSTVKNKFKFIQKTKEIAEHRGDFIEDGIIRIEYAFERKTVAYTYSGCWNDWYPTRIWADWDTRPRYVYHTSERIFTGTNENTAVPCCCTSDELLNSPKDDEGITVKGGEISQNFDYTTIGSLEPSFVITIKLCGIKSNGSSIEKSVTVKDKLVCTSCGKISKSNAQFCYNCGTYLET